AVEEKATADEEMNCHTTISGKDEFHSQEDNQFYQFLAELI
nr:hypothetical protein [Tanacetum cinerariifolium]